MAVGKPSKNGVFKIMDASGVMREFTCNLSSFSRKNGRQMDKTETYCTIEKAPGPNDITYSGKGVWNGAANEIDDVLEQLVNKSDVASYYEWFPQGNTVGQPKYYGSGWVNDKNIDAATPGNVLTDFSVESIEDHRVVIS